MVLQSVLYPVCNHADIRRNKLGKAKKWMKEHGYKIDKIHITKKYYKFIQSTPVPNKCRGGWSYATDVLKNGVQLVYKYYI